MKITILGCGWSSGVPIPGCNCTVCTSHDPRNHRRRASILVEQDAKSVLVDSSPDLRAQLLDAGVSRLDGVIYTHSHADHVHGIDDLRPINYAMRSAIDIYGDHATLSTIESRFSYAFRTIDPTRPWISPTLNAHRIDGPFEVAGIKVRPFDQDHGHMPTLGLRFADAAAYSTDAHALNETAFETLAGVGVWIVDCIGTRPHGTHSHLEQTLGWIERLKPRLAVLTHMSHGLDYETLLAQCPDGVVPAYDGMVIECDDS
jgi:phosphoribosyl 1,2-cyclic phosphate phosphodiesterase